MTIESGDGCFRGFGRNGDQQAAGSLGVEEEIAVFLGNTRCEIDAIANKIAVIFEAAWEESFACGINGSGKIGNGGMIDLEGYRFNSPFRISKRHLPRVAK